MAVFDLRRPSVTRGGRKQMPNHICARKEFCVAPKNVLVKGMIYQGIALDKE